MDKRTDIVRQLKKFKKRLSEQIPVEKVIFFGSRANGRAHRYSDIDIIIVSEKFRGKVSYRRPLGFYRHWTLNYPVDFICYTPSEFRAKSRQITIVRDAVKEGIVI